MVRTSYGQTLGLQQRTKQNERDNLKWRSREFNGAKIMLWLDTHNCVIVSQLTAK